MDAYLREVRMLPVPNPEQNRRFAQFVRQHHSWYKHLNPLPPGNRFTFYLDPRAFEDLPDLMFNRRGWITSFTERRAAWGYWRYCVDRVPNVRTVAGERVVIPAEILAAGSCHLTAFVHPFERTMYRLMSEHLQAFKALRAASDPDAVRYSVLIEDRPWPDMLIPFHERSQQFHAVEHPLLCQRMVHTLDRTVEAIFGIQTSRA